MKKILNSYIGGFDYLENHIASFGESNERHEKKYQFVRIRNTVSSFRDAAQNYLMKRLELDLENIIGLFYGHTKFVIGF